MNETPAKMDTDVCFEIFRDDVLGAANLVDELLGIKTQKSHGSFHGGWHADNGCADYHLKFFPNSHDTGAGHGIEYHRPEFPDYIMMIWAAARSPKGFGELEAKLRHPDIKLFVTGFERNWPKLFWG